jgi:hypothetical protein
MEIIARFPNLKKVLLSGSQLNFIPQPAIFVY